MESKNIKIGALLSYIAIISSVIISFLYTPFMIGVVGDSEYGLFSLVMSIMTFFTVLDFGFGVATVKYVSEHKNRVNQAKESILFGMLISIYFIIGLLTLIIGFLIIININFIFSISLSVNEIRLTRILLIIAIFNIAISFPLSFFSSLLQANQKFIFLNSLKLIRTFLNPLFMIAILLLGYGSIGMLSSLAIINLIFNIITLIFAFKKLKIRIKLFTFDLPLLKEIITYSSIIFVTLIVDRIFWSTDQIILGIMTGPIDVAIYNISTQFNTTYITLSSVVGGMFLPTFTKQIHTEKNANYIRNEYYLNVSRIQFAISAYILFGFILIGRKFINLWVGETYEKSYYITVIVMTGLLFGMSQNITIPIMQAMNKIRFRAYILLSIALLNILLTILLVPKYGSIGAAISTFLSFFLGTGIIMTIYYSKILKLDVKRFIKSILPSIPVFLLIAYLIWFIQGKLSIDNDYFEIIIIFVLFSLLFFISIYFIYMNRVERKQLSAFFRNKQI